MARTKKELTEKEIGEQIEVEVKQPLEKIVPIRLSADHWAELYHYAHELGIGPTTLARMWILEKLAFVRAVPSVPYVSSGVPRILNWPALAPQRLTFDEFMQKLAACFPDDAKQKLLEVAKESMIPPNAENREDLKALLMTGRGVSEIENPILQGIARLAGIEIVEEEAKVKEPKVEPVNRLDPEDLGPEQIEKIIEIVRKALSSS